MLALIASSPLILVVVLMTGFNVSAKKALPLGFVLTAVIGLAVWKMDLSHVAIYTVFGFLNSLDILFIIFGAVLILNTMQHAGAVKVISDGFNNVSKDKRVQLMVVGFLFGSFMEGAAGFGTAAALAGPLLIILGFPPLAAVSLALIFNMAPVSFGAVGSPVAGAMKAVDGLLKADAVNTDVFLQDLVTKTAALHVIGGIPTIFMALFVMIFVFGGKNRSFKAIVEFTPFALLSGLSFFIPSLLVAYYLGPDLPSMLGGFVGLGLITFFAKKKFLTPKTIWDFEDSKQWKEEWFANKGFSQTQEKGEKKQHSLFMSFLPYVLVTIAIAVTRIPEFGLKGLVTSIKLTVYRFGNIEGLDYAFPFIYSPGFIFTVVALIMHFVYKVPAKDLKTTWSSTLKQMSGAVIATTLGLAIVQVMLHSATPTVPKDMLRIMAEGISNVSGKTFLIFSPFIGVLGAFMSGSNTTSNILFSALQYQSAVLSDLPTILIVSLQNVGGAVGHSICVNVVVSACATSGIINREGRILRINLPVAFVYVFIVSVSAGVYYLSKY